MKLLEDVYDIIKAPVPEETTQPQNISVDQKIDGFLISYEKESMLKMESTTKINGFLNFLFEAEDDDKLPTDDAPTDIGAPGGDFGDTPPTDSGTDLAGGVASGGETLQEPPPAPTPQINLNMFAERVARLVMNFDNLINPKDVLLNRVQAFMTKNYNEKTAKELMIALDIRYGLTTQEDKYKDSKDTIGVGAGADDSSLETVSDSLPSVGASGGEGI